MDAFRFSPELFELRARVIEELEAHGFLWLSHKGYGREPGWKAKIQRDRERPRESWLAA
jgi:hypothetical protein